MSKKARILIGAGVLAAVLCGVWAVSEIRIKNAEEAVAASQAAAESAAADAERPGGGPALAAEDGQEEELVSSPDGSVTALSEEDPDYHLKSLRLEKENWHEAEDGTVEYLGKKYKRNSYVKAYLLLGIDTHDPLVTQTDPDKRGVNDGIFLLVHDEAHGTVKVLMIPRDTITEIYQYTENGAFEGEYLNHIALAYSQQADPKLGCANAVGAVQKLLCDTGIDGVAAINLDVIAALTDAVGGVDVTVPNDQLQIADPDWKEGTELHLTGENAELFLRYRDYREQQEDEGPIIRMTQHKEYLEGFSDAVKKTAKTKSGILEELYGLFSDNMVTSLGKEDFLRIGADVMKSSFSGEDIITLPGEEENRDYTEYYADYSQMIPQILELFYREVK